MSSLFVVQTRNKKIPSCESLCPYKRSCGMILAPLKDHSDWSSVNTDQGWTSVWKIFFSVYSTIQGKINGQAFSGQIALRLYNSYNHCRCARSAPVASSAQHLWLSHEPWPNSKCSKQWSGSQIFLFRVKTSTRSPLTKFKKNKIIESAAKLKRMSVL